MVAPANPRGPSTEVESLDILIRRDPAGSDGPPFTRAHAFLVSAVVHVVLIVIIAFWGTWVPAPESTPEKQETVHYVLFDTPRKEPKINVIPDAVKPRMVGPGGAPGHTTRAQAPKPVMEPETRAEAEARPRAPTLPAPTPTAERENAFTLPAAPSPEPTPPTPPDESKSPGEGLSLLASAYAHRPPVHVAEDRSGGGQGGAGGRPGLFGPVQFDAEGYDFTAYARVMVEIVRRNWYAVMPRAAQWGATGRVVVSFDIARDGGIGALKLVAGSGSTPLDRAALGSIEMSNPLPHLPTDFPREKVGVTFSYYYNMETIE